MVSFRLTTEEYSRLRELCYSKGLRSVSEMARVAINGLLQKPGPATGDVIETRLNEIEGRVHMLARDIKRLHQRRWLSRFKA